MVFSLDGRIGRNASRAAAQPARPRAGRGFREIEPGPSRSVRSRRAARRWLLRHRWCDEWRARRPVPQALGGSRGRSEVVCRSTGRHARAAPTGVTATRAWPGALSLIEDPGAKSARSQPRGRCWHPQTKSRLPRRRSLIDAIRPDTVRGSRSRIRVKRGARPGPGADLQKRGSAAVRAGAPFACSTALLPAVPRAKYGAVKEAGRNASGASEQLDATDWRKRAMADLPSGSFRGFALHRRIHAPASFCSVL